MVLASERARQLSHGAEPLVECDNKPAVTSLREIAAEIVHFNEDVTDTVNDLSASAALLASCRAEVGRKVAGPPPPPHRREVGASQMKTFDEIPLSGADFARLCYRLGLTESTGLLRITLPAAAPSV